MNSIIMPKWKRGHTTSHVCVPVTNPRRNIPSEHDQQTRFRLQHSVLDFLSVGPEAKLDMFNNFDLDKPLDLHLDLPSAEKPPFCRIIQEGKDPILTTDFYLTNLEPKPWILPTPPTNNNTTTSSTAAAASNFTPEIQPDPVQPREIRLYLWMLYTPQAPVLDLRGQTITSTLDLETLSTSYIYAQQKTRHKVNCQQILAEGNPKNPKSPTKQLSDSDTSDEEQINPVLKTSAEERHYRTIPGSALATQIALSHSRAQAIPTVERGPSHKVSV